MPLRYDTGTLRKPEKLSNGFLRVDAVLTRTGVFKYLNADGTTRRELRLPQEVFKEDALKSFSMMPVTDTHPPVPLTSQNAKEYQRGSVGEDVRQDGKYVMGGMMVTDAALVSAIESGKKREVSCGYNCDLEWQAGEYEGERYDCIQRNIRGNHVAMVARGRAGPDVRVRLDAADAIMVENQQEEVTVIKIRVDGVEYEVSESVAQAWAKVSEAHADATAALQASAEKEKARADAAEAKVKETEAARADAADPVKLRERIKARVGLEGQASKVLGPTVKLDEMDDLAIRKAVVLKVAPDLKTKLDSLSPAYVEARFDIALDQFQAVQGKQGALRTATKLDDGTEHVDEAPSYEKARAKFISDQRAAGLKPLDFGKK
jgi:hypothetical protein